MAGETRRNGAPHSPRTHLFVYGTLMSGLGRHGLLEGAKLVGRARTYRDQFRMLDVGGAPGLVRTGDDEHVAPVVGEVYEVEESAVKRLARAEGPAGVYCCEWEWLVIEGQEAGPLTYAYVHMVARPHRHRDAAVVPGNDWRAARGV